MKRPQLTCILGAEKNSGGIKSRRSRRQQWRKRGPRKLTDWKLCEDKGGKSTADARRFVAIFRDDETILSLVSGAGWKRDKFLKGHLTK